MNEEHIRARVEQELSRERFSHTVGVVEAAEELARIHGESVERARIAAWIHDIAREWPDERLLNIAERVEIPSGFAAIPAVLHGPVAAVLATEWFGNDDEDVANAIRYHTTGRVGMSRLEMVICLADAIEQGRRYSGVEQLRIRAKQDLAGALAESFDSTLRYLLDRHLPIFPLTVLARNHLWERVFTNSSENREEHE